MENLEVFFADNIASHESMEVVVSKRFVDKEKKPVPFKIKAITEKENQDIRKGCQKIFKQKYGQSRTETDTNLYHTRLIIACTEYPKFKSVDLIDAWKGKGVTSPEDLVNTMLLPGEYTELLLQVQSLNGFDEEDINEVKEEVKKQ